ncbi:tyrosine-protein phosphatase [Fibrella arboris]|uniref:tyrosine-protein phosphatase n=1 Tax=Fibrella arboris TaxID=3242486 RepID=UPI0035227AC3
MLTANEFIHIMPLPITRQHIQQWFSQGSFYTPGKCKERMEAIWAVDIHNHLLPGVDDGITTLDETVRCLKQYNDWGVRQVICTPHISQDYYPNTAEQLHVHLALVQQASLDAGLSITVRLAAEYLLDEEFDRLLKANQLLSFGSARYVLIETGWAAPPHQLDDWLFIMQRKGYTPVLAHPERYLYYQAEPYLLKQLRAQGCLLQLNLLSLAGQYGPKAKRLAFDLLREKCISFVGSDLHGHADLATLQTVFNSTTVKHLEVQPFLMHQLL